MKPIWIVIGVFVVAIVGGGAFYGGMKYGENRLMQNPTQLFRQMASRRGANGQFSGGQFPGGLANRQSGQNGTGQTGNGQTRQFAGGTMGTIESIQGGTLVISTNDGNVQVKTSDTTLVQKYMSANVSDLTVGESVIVMGSKNDDGSITARSIESLRALPQGTGNTQGTGGTPNAGGSQSAGQ